MLQRALVHLAVLVFVVGVANADTTSRFDIATFKVPADWTREEVGTAVRYTLLKDAAFCQINILKSGTGSGDVKTDYVNTWNATATDLKFTGAASSVQRPAIKGWSSKAGRGSFVTEGITIQATVNVYAAGSTTMIILTLGTGTCDASLTRFFASLSLAAPAAAPAVTPTPDAPPTGTTSVKLGDWTASLHRDWVQVTNGSMRVYLYFMVPYDASSFSGTGVVDRDYYWSNYVAKQFAITSTQYRDNGETIGSFKPKYVEGWGTDRATNERRFVAMTLSIAPNAALLAVASAPDEASFRAAFPKASELNGSDLAAMSRFNRFPIGNAKDIAGTWQSGGGQTMNWYDANTGAYVGATGVATSDVFTFAADGSYRSVHNGASGAVGGMKTFQQNYAGTFKVESWRVTATKRFEGRTATFDAHLQAVRGGWLLALDDGRGSSFVLVRTKR